jgi:hypothetical protein
LEKLTVHDVVHATSLINSVGQTMTHAIAVETTRYSEFFRRLFDRYASDCKIEIDGAKYASVDVEALKAAWCTNRKIKGTRAFSLHAGDRFVASFHDSVDELFISTDERDWIQLLSDERLLRYKVLPISK